MSEQIVLQLAGVLILGVAIQWVAWRARFPAILLLLGAGLALGPGSAVLVRMGWLDHVLLAPDELFGELLLPAVSLAVSLVLFEGGMTLNLREHRAASGVIWGLVTVGAVVTFVVAAGAGHWLLGLGWKLAILLGAILVVTGPTVIGPLLRHVRPTGKVAGILKWEGTIIDPIGAMVAILVFESLVSGQVAAGSMLESAAAIMAVGTGCGALAAGVIILFFRRHWVPDFLQNSFVLVLVLLAFAGANVIRHESGLFAATMMGLILGNQRRAHIHHVREFKETLTVLLVSALFVVLGARLTLEQLGMIPWGRMVMFVGVLIVVGRPVAVLVSTIFSGLTWRERAFLAGVAPRGIVAAAVSSVFALRMSAENFEGAGLLVPMTFATIIGSVTFYGLAAGPLGRMLGLSRTGSHGVLIAGAGLFARMLGKALQEEGQAVLLVDTNLGHIAAARLQGLPVLPGSVISRLVMEEVEFSGLGGFLALTPNDELNALAALQYQRTFSRQNVFQLAPDPRSSARQEKVAVELRGRVLFSREVTYGALERLAEAGWVIKKTALTEAFTFQRFLEGKGVGMGLFVKTAGGDVQFFTAELGVKGGVGDVVVSFGPPRKRDA
jgi:NhaP-type Na+/H+ or K+/H+ antiporter